MASRNKILKQADRLAHRGHHAEAAEKLLQLVDENPRDVNLLNRAGDLFVRAGKVDEAVEQFGTIARYFKEDGFLLKAIAIYKKISKLDPLRIETFMQLGELYAERGLRMEAKQNLQHAAEAFGKRGDSDSERRALEQLEQLDPDDTAVQSKLTDMAEEGGDTGEAAARHLESARRFLAGGQREEALAALEKAIVADPVEEGLLRGVGELLVDAGEPGRAAALMTPALPGIESPGLEFLLTLGRAHREAGDPQKARPHFEEALKLDYGNDRCHVEMALCHLAGGDSGRAFDQCRHVLNHPAEKKSVDLCRYFLDAFLDKEPFDPHALRELAVLEQDAGDDDAFQQVLSRLAGACHQAGLHREELRILTLLAGRATGDAATVLQNRRDEAEALAVGQEGAVDEMLVDFLPEEGAEGADDETAQAESPDIEVDFDPPPAMEANGSDRVVLGAEDEQVPAGEPEIELIIEDTPLGGSDAIVIEEEPSMADLVDPVMPAEPVDEDEPAAAAKAEEPAGEPEPETEAPVPVDENEIRERITATRVFLSYGMLNKALGQVEELLVQYPDRADVCELAAAIYRSNGMEEKAAEMQARMDELTPGGAAAETPAAAVPPASPSWMNGSGDEPPVTEVPEVQAPAEPPVEGEPPEAPAAATVPAPAAADSEIDPLAEDLEEIDFFISQGFMAEARDLVQGLLKTNPDHLRLLELLEQVGGPVEQEAAETPDPAEATAADETTPAVAAPPPTSPPVEQAPAPLADDQLSEVFTRFQEEVAGQVDEEDFGTHYDLGIAYKEMMLVDEAIGEFQIAARSSEKRLDCCVMLGACFMEKGMPGEAVKWYEKGLDVSETGSDESKGLQYELAAALEADGAADKALEVFKALAAMDDQYRDVSTRIDRLRSA